MDRFKYPVVFVTALILLLLELTQTRILSAIYFNNVVYLTVTVALLGFGISGVLVSILAPRINSERKLLAKLSIGLSAACFISPYISSHIPEWLENAPFVVAIGISYFVLTAPFIIGGAIIGTTFMFHNSQIYKLYFVDLIGSTCGVLLFAVMLRPLGAENLIWICGALATFPALIIAEKALLQRVFKYGILGLIAFGFLLFHGDIVGEMPTRGKTLYPLFVKNELDKIETSIWSIIAKIDIVEDWNVETIAGKRGEAVNRRIITQDGTAHTHILPAHEVEKIFEESKNPDIPSFSKFLFGMRPNPEATMVIGVGGGRDIVDARAHGARRIVGIELNDVTVDLMNSKYREFAQWPSWPNVDLIASEGRHFVRRDHSTYDLMIMTVVDTFSALNSGAYVLSENYLYTVEAIVDYLKLLKPGGVLYISRWIYRQPRESLRLFGLYLEAAKRQNIIAPERNIAVIGQGGGLRTYANTLIKNDPFNVEEIQRLIEAVEYDDNLSIVYLPKVYPVEEQRLIELKQFRSQTSEFSVARKAYADLAKASIQNSREAFENTYPFNISIVTDDRPFFFENTKSPFSSSAGKGSRSKLRGHIVQYTLYVLLFFAVLISYGGIIFPLTVFAREGLKIRGLRSLMWYFSSLGLGFMFIEIGLMQKLALYLGHPMYSLTVVLAGLLFFTGVGSLITGQFRIGFQKALALGMLGTALITMILYFVLPTLMAMTEHWLLAARVIFALAMILPLGMTMGIPFATGLRYIGENYPRFTPWAWGVNGMTSVAGSIIAIILAMRFGFSMVLVLGAGIYAFGYAVMRFHTYRNASWKIFGT